MGGGQAREHQCSFSPLRGLEIAVVSHVLISPSSGGAYRFWVTSLFSVGVIGRILSMISAGYAKKIKEEHSY